MYCLIHQKDDTNPEQLLNPFIPASNPINPAKMNPENHRIRASQQILLEKTYENLNNPSWTWGYVIVRTTYTPLSTTLWDSMLATIRREIEAHLKEEDEELDYLDIDEAEEWKQAGLEIPTAVDSEVKKLMQ